MASLSLSTASRIAFRELRHSRGKFAFVVLSVAIGVAALTGVRGFASSFRTMLLLNARSIMAADIGARMNRQPTPAERTTLTSLSNIKQTEVTELTSMASSAKSMDPLIVSVKAIDPANYPFYGKVDLAPSQSLQQALTNTTIAVGDELLFRLHLNLGDQLKLGTQLFRIVATVQNEPDRLSGSFAVGPRVLISREALATTGLLQPGSRSTDRLLFQLPASALGKNASDKPVADLKAQLEKLLPDAQISDYRESSPALTKGLDGAEGLLSLMSLVALVLGAVGVAMAMRAHLQQRLDTIAIMKSIGAQSTQIIKIYLIQTILLGLAGGVVGCVLGMGVQLAFPLFLAKLLHITPDFRLDPRAYLIGLAAGLLTTLLFTLPPLLDIRSVRPILILRRAVEGSDDPFSTRWLRKLKGSAVQFVAGLVILIGLAALAASVSDSKQVGFIFAGGLAIVLLVLLGMSSITLFLLRKFLARTRLGLPSPVRHGLSNLYRPGNPSAALLAALGLGVMQIVTVYIAQRAVVDEMSFSIAANTPNLFLIDIASNEVAGVRTLLSHQPGVKGTPELIPVVTARLVSANGVPAADLKLQHMPRRMLQSLQLTWPTPDDQIPAGDKVVEGKWWTAAEAAASAQHPLVAIEQKQAERLNLHIGNTVTFDAQDSDFTPTVSAIYATDSQHTFSRAQFVLPSPVLKDLPVVWYGGVHCDVAATTALERALYQSYPTITVINVAATLEVVRQVILQITYVIQFLAAFSIFAGIVILASSIAGTRYRRIREVVVLKTLGATRRRIATIFSIEFAVLGLVAGFVGLIFANIVARLVLIHAMNFEYHFAWGLNLSAWFLTALLTVAAGWLASHRILGQKPLEVLREE